MCFSSLIFLFFLFSFRLIHFSFFFFFHFSFWLNVSVFFQFFMFLAGGLALPHWGWVGPSLSWVGVGPSCFPLSGVGVSPSGPSGRVGPSLGQGSVFFIGVRVGLPSRGRGWPFGSGLARARPKRGMARPSQKGEKWKARGPARRKGRGGARPDPEGEDWKAHF